MPQILGIPAIHVILVLEVVKPTDCDISIKCEAQGGCSKMQFRLVELVQDYFLPVHQMSKDLFVSTWSRAQTIQNACY